MSATIPLTLPSEFYELLAKADILLPENVLMFFTNGLGFSMSTNEKLRFYITSNGVDCDELFRMSCEVSMAAAELSLKKKFADA